MPILKNSHLLEGVLKQSDIDKMEHAALQHLRYSNITFKIIDLSDKKVVIQVTQGKSAQANYQTGKRLIEIVNETFGRFFSDRKINVGPIPFVESPANQVDDKWIQKQMEKFNIKLKDITADTGIDKTQLSSVVSGDRPNA
jgi:transcriptional regulator with AAA-type ATPase domain